MLTRRHFLESAALTPFLLKVAAAAQPLRIAVIATVYDLQSDPQQLCDRFLVGYAWEGEWHRPAMKVVSLYVDQKSDGDLSGERAQQFGFKVYPTIADALSAGGTQLACDAVLLIPAGGKYSENEYPARKFFDECVKVFQKSGKAVPVFNAYNLAETLEQAKSMVSTAGKLKFPLLAGSWMPLTWRLPDFDLPTDAEPEEVLIAGGGVSDQMHYHSLDALQSVVERRKGGERGIASVQLIEGAAVWDAQKAGVWSKELLSSALSRSDTPLGLTVKDGRTQDLVGSGVLPGLATKPVAYVIKYRDGLRGTVLMLDGAVRDYNFAARIRGKGLLSWQFLITPEPDVTYSTGLAAHIEQMFLTGKAPYPVERSLLTTGVLEASAKSRAGGNKAVETPQLAIAYRAPNKSEYTRT
jgi:hypothetical protein